MVRDVPGEFQYDTPRHSDEELLQVFWSQYHDSESHFSHWRVEIQDYYALYGSESLLSEADREFAKAVKRPLINLNFCLNTINAILGSQMAERKEVQFKGVGTFDFDGVVAEWLTILCRTSMQYCDAHRLLSDSYLDALISGYGYVETYLDTSDLPLHAKVGSCQPWEMYPDPNAIEDCLSDAKYLIRRRLWDLEEAEARWPNKREAIQEGVQAGTIEKEVSIHGVFSGENVNMRTKVPIYEWQYMRYEPWGTFIDEEGNYTMLSMREIKLLEEQMDQKYDVFQFARRVFYRCYVTGNSSKGSGIILERKPISVNRFTYSIATGYKKKDPEQGRCIFFGPMRVVVDIQKYLNRAFSVYMEIMARGAKGGGMIEEGMIPDNPEEFEQQASKAGGWVVVGDDAIAQNRVRERGAQPIPQGHEAFMSHLIQSFAQLTGVTDHLKGTAQGERSNVLVSNMQQQNLTTLNPLFDPMTSFMINVGKQLISIILKHYQPEQIDRILSDQVAIGLTHEKQQDPETGMERVVQVRRHSDVLKNVRLDDFEITADMGQASVTQKQMVWQILVQTNLIGTLLENGVDVSSILPKLVQFMPLPESLAKQLSQDLEETMQFQKSLQTQEGVIMALSQMRPEEIQQVVSQAMATMQQNQGGQQPAA